MAAAGLRERKKQETRVALRSAALRLTAERGLDRVTVEDIAEAADVSPRTFFNYFSTKEEAVIGGDPGGIKEVLAVLSTRPANEEPLFSLHAVLREIANGLAADRELLDLRMKVIADNPALLPRHVAAFVEFERVLVEAITDRRKPGPAADPALVVASAVAALRVSVDLWIAGQGRAHLPELFDRAIDQLAHGLVAPKAQPAVRPPATSTDKRLRNH